MGRVPLPLIWPHSNQEGSTGNPMHAKEYPHQKGAGATESVPLGG